MFTISVLALWDIYSLRKLDECQFATLSAIKNEQTYCRDSLIWVNYTLEMGDVYGCVARKINEIKIKKPKPIKKRQTQKSSYVNETLPKSGKNADSSNKSNIRQTTIATKYATVRNKPDIAANHHLSKCRLAVSLLLLLLLLCFIVLWLL